MVSNLDADRVKILLLPIAIRAVDEGVVAVTGAEEEGEEDVEAEVEAEVEEVVEEVVGEVHRHRPLHRVRVLEDEEVVRIAKRKCSNNWKRFCVGNK